MSFIRKRRGWLLPIILFAVAPFLFQPSAVSAESVHVRKVSNWSTGASVSGKAGKVSTTVNLIVLDSQAWYDAGPPVVGLEVSQSWGSHYIYRTGHLELAPGHLTFEGLDSASLNAEVEVCEIGERAGKRCIDVTLNLAWTGIGPISYDPFGHTDYYDDCSIDFLYEDRIREASVTGSVQIKHKDLDISSMYARDIWLLESTVIFTGDGCVILP